MRPVPPPVAGLPGGWREPGGHHPDRHSGAFLEAFRVNQAPMLLLIDRDGKVMRRWVGYSTNLGEELSSSSGSQLPPDPQAPPEGEPRPRKVRHHRRGPACSSAWRTPRSSRRQRNAHHREQPAHHRQVDHDVRQEVHRHPAAGEGGEAVLDRVARWNRRRIRSRNSASSRNEPMKPHSSEKTAKARSRCASREGTAAPPGCLEVPLPRIPPEPTAIFDWMTW